MATEERRVFDATARAVSGEFVDIGGEHFYAIRNVDRMQAFFVSLISDSDHWLFASSNGALTAGRVSPETALFPYVTVDKIHDSVTNTGSTTLVRQRVGGSLNTWEPFAATPDDRFEISRSIYKSVLGNKLCFEETNRTLQISFRYTWLTSESYGFVRHCELTNLGASHVELDLIDGLQNILPAGTPRFAQTNTSNLVDAYKWTELDEQTGLAFFTLYSGITDRAEPCESLRANTVFSLGLPEPTLLLSAQQLGDFRGGMTPQPENRVRGTRGAYLAAATLRVEPRSTTSWQLVADIEKDQADVLKLRNELRDGQALLTAIQQDIERGSDALARIMASGDAFQTTAEDTVSAHHYANVMFNVLRGGIFDEHYSVCTGDFRRTLRCFDRTLEKTHASWLSTLPEKQPFAKLLDQVIKTGDPQLRRLCQEYLPIRFGRRHGDPSRPWNQFAIELKDDDGSRLLAYQGNWRDIFQNWEALAHSYPEFVENMIAKFVNASTVDGYNPYRITDEGIDWEVEEPDDPWSYIGYWGDHQIIYLQKLLELSSQYNPARLAALLHEPVFAYANVPYRIRAFDETLADPKSTVDYDEELAAVLAQRVSERGADGKLVLDSNGSVYLVTLLEKLIVPLLSKLSNFVVRGGIWLNTQRPEWNDANNALVGQGLSMVTLYYMRRYVTFLRQLIAGSTATFALSQEVADWLNATGSAMAFTRKALETGSIDDAMRYETLERLGLAGSDYRQRVYRQGMFSATCEQPVGALETLLDDTLIAIDDSIKANRRDDGLYHAYNIVGFEDQAVTIRTLYPMLEGQVAALSSGGIEPAEASEVIDALFASDVYRADQHSFMLYPDRSLPGFLRKNRIAEAAAETIALLQSMLADHDERLVVRDPDGALRFNADLVNAGQLERRLDDVRDDYPTLVEQARKPLKKLYEAVFDHQSFTGRSGTMFGFEGLGCIYWHMVSKFLLAVQENYFRALEIGQDNATIARLGEQYYRVRAGIGFNKSPEEFGAFPTDPYSHTPRHAGARQPGMTGQVKEEIITRFGELGVRVNDGEICFRPSLLRRREFIDVPMPLRYLDVDGNWQQLQVSAGALAFSWCQIPVIYELTDASDPTLTLTLADGQREIIAGDRLPTEMSRRVFSRSGAIRQILLSLPSAVLFDA